MAKTKKIFLFMIFFAILTITGCSEGEDASFFNGVNELEVTGTIAMETPEFDHTAILMKVHLFRNDDFSQNPVANMSLKWYRKDDQGNTVFLDETSTSFFEAVSPGDYYAFSFIDLNKNSEVDADEPYDVWQEADGSPKVIRVREESRWEISFLFETQYSEFE